MKTPTGPAVADFYFAINATFRFILKRFGREGLRQYWDAVIHQDSQWHAAELIQRAGIEGMKKYWGHTTVMDKLFRIDMHQCLSKGFMQRNGLEQYRDCCDHAHRYVSTSHRAGREGPEPLNGHAES